MTQTTPSFPEVLTAPPVDPELVPDLGTILEVLPRFGGDTPLATLREMTAEVMSGAEKTDLTAGGRVRVDERAVPAGEDGVELALTVLTPATGPGPWPLVYHIHGGGMVVGDRFLGLDPLVPYVAEGRAVVASIEYRLAPEHPDPVPVTDCYTGLRWCADHAAELRVDPGHLVVTAPAPAAGSPPGPRCWPATGATRT